MGLMHNLGKTARYVLPTVARNLMPTTSDTITNSAEFARDAKESLQDASRVVKQKGLFKGIAELLPGDEGVSNDPFGGVDIKTKLANTAKNLKTGFTTGDFSGGELDEEDEFSDFGDFSFDDVGSSGTSDSDKDSPDSTSATTTGSIQKIKNDNRRFNKYISAPNYITNVNGTSNKMTKQIGTKTIEALKLNTAASINGMNKMNRNLFILNDNTAKLVQFNSEQVAGFHRQTLMFYTTAGASLTSISEGIKEANKLSIARDKLLGLHKSNEFKESDYAKVVGDNDPFSALRNYFSHMGGKIKDMAGMASMMMGGDDAKSFNPLAMLAERMLPSKLTKGAKDIDDMMALLPKMGHLKLNKLMNSLPMEMQMLTAFMDPTLSDGNNVRFDIKKSNKEGARFNALTQKSIVTVIPNMLSKILRAVDKQGLYGDSELIFDHNKGSFTNTKDALEQFKTERKSAIKDGIESGLTAQLTEVLGADVSSEEIGNHIDKLLPVFDKLTRDNQYFGAKDYAKSKSSDFGLDENDDSWKVLGKILNQSKLSEAKLNSNIMPARDKLNEFNTEIETLDPSKMYIYSLLANDPKALKKYFKNPEISKSFDPKNNPLALRDLKKSVTSLSSGTPLPSSTFNAQALATRIDGESLPGVTNSLNTINVLDMNGNPINLNSSNKYKLNRNGINNAKFKKSDINAGSVIEAGMYYNQPDKNGELSKNSLHSKKRKNAFLSTISTLTNAPIDAVNNMISSSKNKSFDFLDDVENITEDDIRSFATKTKTKGNSVLNFFKKVTTKLKKATTDPILNFLLGKKNEDGERLDGVLDKAFIKVNEFTGKMFTGFKQYLFGKDSVDEDGNPIKEKEGVINTFKRKTKELFNTTKTYLFGKGEVDEDGNIIKKQGVFRSVMDKISDSAKELKGFMFGKYNVDKDGNPTYKIGYAEVLLGHLTTFKDDMSHYFLGAKKFDPETKKMVREGGYLREFGKQMNDGVVTPLKHWFGIAKDVVVTKSKDAFESGKNTLQSIKEFNKRNREEKGSILSRVNNGLWSVQAGLAIRLFGVRGDDNELLRDENGKIINNGLVGKLNNGLTSILSKTTSVLFGSYDENGNVVKKGLLTNAILITKDIMGFGVDQMKRFGSFVGNNVYKNIGPKVWIPFIKELNFQMGRVMRGLGKGFSSVFNKISAKFGNEQIKRTKEFIDKSIISPFISGFNKITSKFGSFLTKGMTFFKRTSDKLAEKQAKREAEQEKKKKPMDKYKEEWIERKRKAKEERTARIEKQRVAALSPTDKAIEDTAKNTNKQVTLLEDIKKAVVPPDKKSTKGKVNKAKSTLENEKATSEGTVDELTSGPKLARRNIGNKNIKGGTRGLANTAEAINERTEANKNKRKEEKYKDRVAEDISKTAEHTGSIRKGFSRIKAILGQALLMAIGPLMKLIKTGVVGGIASLSKALMGLLTGRGRNGDIDIDTPDGENRRDRRRRRRSRRRRRGGSGGSKLKKGLKVAGKVGKVALKAVPGVGLALVGLDAIGGAMNAGDMLDKEEGEDVSFGERLAGGAGGLVEGLTFGLADGSKIAKGLTGQGGTEIPHGKITSKFGSRTSPFSGKKVFHPGTDIALKPGTGVKPMGGKEGKVTKAGYDKTLGNHVEVQHTNGLKTKYGHLNGINVKQGQKVTSNTLLGKSGSTGKSTGPHLHFEATKNGKYINSDKIVGGGIGAKGPMGGLEVPAGKDSKKSTLNTILSGVANFKNIGSTLIKKGISGTKDMASDVVEKGKNVVEAIKDKAVEVKDNIKETVSNVTNTIKEKLSGFLGGGMFNHNNVGNPLAGIAGGGTEKSSNTVASGMKKALGTMEALTQENTTDGKRQLKFSKGMLDNQIEPMRNMLKKLTQTVLAGGATALGVAGGSSSGDGMTTGDAGPVNLKGNSNTEKIWNFFKEKGFSDSAVAGIMGNLQQESGMDPNKHQYGGPGRGIVQWEEGSDRFASLQKYAANMGKEWNSLDAQLGFLWKEMSNTKDYSRKLLERKYGGMDNFKKIDDPVSAVHIFERSFERAGKPMYEKRNSYAKAWLDKYGGNKLSQASNSKKDSKTKKGKNSGGKASEGGTEIALSRLRTGGPKDLIDFNFMGGLEVPAGEKNASTMKGSSNSGASQVNPVKGININSGFGGRTIGTKPEQHRGVDIPKPTGTPVYAFRDGTVKFAGSFSDKASATYGNVIFITHANGLETRYAHLSKINVTKGQTVKAGQKIGEVGSTGRSTGPHLHFETILNGNLQNPVNYLNGSAEAEGSNISGAVSSGESSSTATAPTETSILSIGDWFKSKVKYADVGVSRNEDGSLKSIAAYQSREPKKSNKQTKKENSTENTGKANSNSGGHASKGGTEYERLFNNDLDFSHLSVSNAGTGGTELQTGGVKPVHTNVTKSLSSTGKSVSNTSKLETMMTEVITLLSDIASTNNIISKKNFNSTTTGKAVNKTKDAVKNLKSMIQPKSGHTNTNNKVKMIASGLQ